MASRHPADAAGEQSSSKLSAHELARGTGTTTDFIDRLVEVGVIGRDGAGMHDVGDIPQVRLAHAFELSGVGPDSLAAAMGSGLLQLEWVSRVWPPPPPGSRSYADFAAALGERAALLPQLYVAFGLAEPSPDTMMRADEEQAITEFIDLWSTVDDRLDVYLRAARIAGEGIRRLQEATLDLFDASGGSPPQRVARGLAWDDAMEPSLRMNPMLANLLPWLEARHSEHETFGRIVSHVERQLARAGRLDRPPEEPTAIAFVDLAGYTELTESAGDEQAAASATALQTLAESAARRHAGRVVKLLGDGVMLRYRSAQAAVESVLELMSEIARAGLPAAHAGIATGPVVVRDGDVYGHTVNLAARVAGHARAGELLLSSDAADHLTADGIVVERLGPAQLKGMSQPVTLARVMAAPGRRGPVRRGG